MAEDTNEKILLGHTFCHKRECQSDSKEAYIWCEQEKRLNTESGLTIGNCNNHECYQNDNDLYECHSGWHSLD